MTWRVPVIVGLLYVAGLALHEATHAGAVLATGGRIDRFDVGLNALTLVYEHTTHRQDALIRAAPVGAFAPLVVAAVLLARPRGWGWLYLAGFALGYLPRSASDWAGVRALLPA